MVIGITGGIGSGKTTLSNLLRSHGLHVYDTDLEARRLQDEDQILVQQIKHLLGESVYKNKSLDRSTVAEIVFNQPALLSHLSAIVHPIVKRDFLEWKAGLSCEDLLFIESAVLFEGKFDELTDKIILLTAPEEIRIQRVQVRDNATRKQIIARIKNQIPDAEKALKSDLIIHTENGLPHDIVSSIIKWKH